MPRVNAPTSKAEILKNYIYTYVLGLRNPPTYGPHDNAMWKSFEVVVDGIEERNPIDKLYISGLRPLPLPAPGTQPGNYVRPAEYIFPRSDIKKLKHYLSFRKFINPKRNYGLNAGRNEHQEVLNMTEDPNFDEILEKTPIYKYEGPTEAHRLIRDNRGLWYKFREEDVPTFKLHFNRGAEMTPREMGIAVPVTYNNPPNEGVKNVPHNAENALTFEDIQEGDEMVNFFEERNKYGHYFKKSTFNGPYMPIRAGETYKRHPLRQPWNTNQIAFIKPTNVKTYKAHKLPPPPPPPAPASSSSSNSNSNSRNSNSNTRNSNSNRRNNNANRRNNNSNRRNNTSTNNLQNRNRNTTRKNNNNNSTPPPAPGIMGRLRGFFGF